MHAPTGAPGSKIPFRWLAALLRLHIVPATKPIIAGPSLRGFAEVTYTLVVALDFGHLSCSLVLQRYIWTLRASRASV
ncbi:hypothetical protein EDB86DRAFT_819554 [Lactarius hatsudake]|nr:hypothetical protein EDB86DRAFT_819554 [Lactarius hatsudake]